MDDTRDADTLAVAIVAGGCFWCTEADFEKLDGVVEAVSGYTGGDMPDPTYDAVCAGGTGHREAVRIVFDPSRTSYAALLDHFWRHVDPTDPGGQFVDRGDQYRTAVFYLDEEQRQTAEASKAALDASGRFDRPVVTDILPAGPFYPAEDQHQGYFKRCPIRYEMYRRGSGRDRFIETHGGD
ncbi:MAG: peptide-methionine (S)-S-oxide reductase MsrA [Candidatus Krumholzibacteriota bacterium]|nr:peptide-methionine (S)-S-oxide reductase MsrA [Candidatus Krumholzibacteriota bacterium]